MAETKQPNMYLFVMADQMSHTVLPREGEQGPAKMPHLAKLMKEGVVFDSAYTNSPLCAPSRFSMVSGRLPSKIGAYDNASNLGSDIPTYAHYLRSLGYHTALSGKQHFVGADQLHGYEERLTSDIYPADFGWTVDWNLPDVRPDWYHNMSSVEEAGPCAVSNQLDYDEEVSYQSHKYLWKRARHHRDQPFCLTVSFTHPHDPYAAKQEFWDMYEGEEIVGPKVPAFKHEDQDPHSKRLLKVIDLYGKEFTDEQIKRARRAYYANCTYVDDKIGGLIKTLKDAQLLDNTIIFFSGDHGDQLGERGLWFKMHFFEGAARVPMVAHFPKRFAPGRVSSSVSTLDILPTFVQLAGGNLDPNLPIEGRSLVSYLQGKNEGHDEVIGEYFGEATIAPLFMIRRKQWKFIWAATDPALLYNLQEDPLELINLSKDPAHAKIMAAFQQEVKDRWDVPKITAEVIQSQVRRRLVGAALREGKKTTWDHQPMFDSSKEFIRNNDALDNMEHAARYPPPQHYTA